MTTRTASRTNRAAATSVVALGVFAMGMVAQGALAAAKAPVSRKRGYYASDLSRS